MLLRGMNAARTPSSLHLGRPLASSGGVAGIVRRARVWKVDLFVTIRSSLHVSDPAPLRPAENRSVKAALDARPHVRGAVRISDADWMPQ